MVIAEEQEPVAAPSDPPSRARRLYDYMREEKQPVPDSYEEFERGLRDPERVKRLHTFLREEGQPVPADVAEFQAGLAPAESKKKEATGPASAAPAPEPASAPAAGSAGPHVEVGDIEPAHDASPDWDAIGKWAPGAPAQLATVDGAPLVRLNDQGEHERVAGLPKPEKGSERVRVPADYQGPAIPGSYQLPASTDPTATYFDRPLSKVAQGETQEQDKWTAAGRTFVNTLKDMGEGGLNYLGALDRRLMAASADEVPGKDPLQAFAATHPGTPVDASGHPTSFFQQGADAIEGSKQPVARFHSEGELELGNPATWPVPAARNAALAVPLVLSAAFPEGKVAQVLQKVAAVGFDSQMMQGSFDRAKQAGLPVGSKEYDSYALADATATMVVFKGLGHVLEAPAQELLRRTLVNRTLARVAEGASFDEAFAAASKGAAPLLEKAATGAASMGTLGAANAVKTKLGERAYNAATGTPAFPEKSLGEDLADIGHETLSMGLIGALGGVAGHLGMRGEAPAFDVVRPTGQVEMRDVRVLGPADKAGEVPVAYLSEQGTPAQARVKEAYLTPRAKADVATHPTLDQAGDPAGAPGHAQGAPAQPEEAQPESPAPEPGSPQPAEGSAGEQRAGARPAGGDEGDGAGPLDGGEPARPVRAVAAADIHDLLPEATESDKALRSDDGHVAAAVAPDGLIRLRASEDATPGSGQAVLDEAVAQGGTRVQVAHPAVASFLQELGWKVESSAEGDIRLSPPVQDTEAFTNSEQPAETEQPTAQYAPTPQHAPVGSRSQAGQRPVLAELHDGQPVKSLRDIFLDLRKSVGGALHFGKRPAGQGRGTGSIPGQYDPGTKAITVRPGAISTTAHELGHRLDENFDLLNNVPQAAWQELWDLARHGSAAPAGHRQPAKYAAGEGLAEFVRGLLLDPEHMKSAYPELTAYFEDKVDAGARGQLTDFSNDIRRLYSQRGAVNLEMEAPAEPTLKEKVFGKPTPGSAFKLDVFDKLRTWFTDDRHPIGKMYDYLLEQAGRVRPKGAEDAMRQLARLSGFQSRLANQVTEGLTPLVEAFTKNADGTITAVRLRDPQTGEALTLDWLHQPFQGGTEAEVRERMRQSGELMIAQRTLEELDNRIGDRIEDVLDAGGHVDPALLQKYPQLAQRKIEVTDRATATTPRQKRTLTYEQANQENAARRGAHAQRVADARQKRAQAVDAGIDRQVDRWQDYAQRARQAWKQAKTSNEARTIIEELLGKVEAEEAAAGFSEQGKRVAGKVSTLLKRAAKELARADAATRSAKVDALLDRVGAKMEERVRGLEKLRAERQKAVATKYDGKLAELTGRAQPTAVSEQAEGPLTGIGADIHDDADRARHVLQGYDQLRQQDPAHYDSLVEGARRYRVWADANLQKAVDAGLLSQEEYAAIQERQTQYVALQRIMDAAPGESISTFAAVQRKGVGGGKKTTYRFKGSDRSIKNPWASLLDSTARTIAEADRNAAMLALREAAVGASQAGADTSAVARNVTGQEAKGEKVKIYVNGQAEEWQFDAEVQAAMQAMGATTAHGPVGKVAAAVAGFTRSAITLNPAFVVRNLARDFGEGVVVSTSGQHKGLEVLWNKQASAMSEEILHLMGGGQAGNFARTEADYHKLLDQAIQKISQNPKSVVARLGEAPAKIWERYKALAEKGETFGRKREVLAAYKKAQAQGMSDRDAAATAAFMARDLMDFSTAGSVVRKINQFVPFTNARVQGLRRLYRTAKQDKVGFAVRFTAYALMPALAEQAIIAASGRDDEYAQFPAYQKEGFYNIPLPSGGWYTIAKPFEIGASATMVASLIQEYGLGQERASEGMVKHVGETALPINFDPLAGGPVKPIVEVMANHDSFRDRSIIPKAEEQLAVEYRHTEKGSRLGQAIGAVTGADSRNVDHIVEGMGGSTGKLATALSDIGRGDEGKGPGLNLTGAYTQEPVAHGRDVEWFNDKLGEYGLTGSEPAKLLKAKLNAYYAAQGDDELRHELAQQLRELAKRLRQDYPEERLRQMKYEKDHPGQQPEDE